MRNQWNHDPPPGMPGKKVFDQRVATTKGHNQHVETALDLKPALRASGLGQAIAIVEPYPWTNDWEPPKLYAWVQSTKLAVDAYVDADKLVAFATELGSAKPAANVEVELRPYGVKAATDDKGLALT